MLNKPEKLENDQNQVQVQVGDKQLKFQRCSYPCNQR